MYSCKNIIGWAVNLLFLFSLASCEFVSEEEKLDMESQIITTADIPLISVQLWSVKNDLKADFKGTVESLAQMGFQGVEFAGDFGPYQNKPNELKAFLIDNSLQVSGAHVGFDLLTEDKIDATLSFYQQLGVQFIIVPWDERAWHPTGVIEVAKELTMLSEKLKPYGLLIGFHNHDKEFNDFQGSTYWDYIAQNTPDSVLLQLDAGWVNYAGKDPISYVKKYAGRTLTTHYKVRTKYDDNIVPVLGQDNYDWAELIQVDIEFGGTKWIVVEQEEYPNGLTPMQAVAQSKLGLDNIIENL
jgi:sugar phosphate isomerase/epimerase